MFRGEVVMTRGNMVMTRGEVVMTRGNMVMTRDEVVMTRGNMVLTRITRVVSTTVGVGNFQNQRPSLLSRD